jgi:hypothetical protein
MSLFKHPKYTHIIYEHKTKVKTCLLASNQIKTAD